MGHRDFSYITYISTYFSYIGGYVTYTGRYIVIPGCHGMGGGGIEIEIPNGIPGSHSKIPDRDKTLEFVSLTNHKLCRYRGGAVLNSLA